ncbi:MAG: transglycosylase SLT domain-containing protein [Thermodesulfobacteriota bacterium]
MKHLLLSGIAVVLLALPATAGSEVTTEVQTEVPTEAPTEIPNTRPPVSSFRVPEQMSLCGERVPLERTDVKERLEREFYSLLDRQGLLVTYIKRAARCNPIVEVILEMEELPEDLKYVPVAESELAFRAKSPANAEGYWQFIESTAKRHGLKVDGYIDERRDLTRSTLAAAAYLKDLHEMFGSWTTALAGYNWGESNVKRAIKEQGTNSYYDLYLPMETERYVFRILALKLIMEQPETYSIHVPEDERYRLPKVMEVEIASETPISIDILADSANAGARTIRDLNPWMRRNVLPAGRYVIAVPAEQADGYADRVSERLSERKKVVHAVKRGENLSTIASKYNVTVESIEKWNNISRKKPIHFGQRLTIWQ